MLRDGIVGLSLPVMGGFAHSDIRIRHMSVVVSALQFGCSIWSSWRARTDVQHDPGGTCLDLKTCLGKFDISICFAIHNPITNVGFL